MTTHSVVLFSWRFFSPYLEVQFQLNNPPPKPSTQGNPGSVLREWSRGKPNLFSYRFSDPSKRDRNECKIRNCLVELLPVRTGEVSASGYLHDSVMSHCVFILHKRLSSLPPANVVCEGYVLHLSVILLTGVSAPGGGCLLRGGVCSGGVCSRGVSAPGRGVCSRGVFFWHTVNARAVRILLECILVSLKSMRVRALAAILGMKRSAGVALRVESCMHYEACKRRGCTMAVKSRGNVTRNPEEGHQGSHKRPTIQRKLHSARFHAKKEFLRTLCRWQMCHAGCV